MSWFSGMFHDEVPDSGQRGSSNNNDSDAFRPSEDSLRVFDELKGQKNAHRWGSGSHSSKHARSGLPHGDGDGITEEVPTQNNSRHVQQRNMQNNGLQNCRRWFAGLDIGGLREKPNELPRHLEGVAQYLQGFKPSEESLRIFDEIKSGAPRMRMSSLRTGKRAAKRGRDKRFDPFQRRWGDSGASSKGYDTRMLCGLVKHTEPVPPLDSEAVKWADAVRALERRTWDDCERELAKHQQKQLPPQLRSHYPSVASGNVVAWEVEGEELEALRREHQLERNKQCRKEKGMFDAVWKVSKEVATRFKKLVERAWRGVLEAGKSFLSLLSQTQQHDTTRNENGYDLHHENRNSDVSLESSADDQV